MRSSPAASVSHLHEVDWWFYKKRHTALVLVNITAASTEKKLNGELLVIQCDEIAAHEEKLGISIWKGTSNVLEFTYTSSKQLCLIVSSSDSPSS